ncbi:MAG: hypothetical protein SWK90_11355 [Chloroflexota bacterium]|nr:hypothetical protein [Chloroflexota bacterium]
MHYIDLAQSLDVSPVTAYEMLHLLEDKYLVRSETVRPQGRGGRSVIIFSPTERATALLAELTGSTVSMLCTPHRLWERTKVCGDF